MDPLTLTTLVVEDDPIIAMSIVGALEDAGIHATQTGNVQDAWSLLETGHYRAAILDFHLARGDTAELAQALTERGMPIIFCTGSIGDEVRAQFPDAIVVEKPFSDEQLVEAVLRVGRVAN